MKNLLASSDVSKYWRDISIPITTKRYGCLSKEWMMHWREIFYLCGSTYSFFCYFYYEYAYVYSGNLFG